MRTFRYAAWLDSLYLGMAMLALGVKSALLPLLRIQPGAETLTQP